MRSLLLYPLLAASAVAERLLYRNTFDNIDAIADWVAEGSVKATVFNNTLELAAPGDFVYWVPEVFPERIRITWEFSPIEEPGLAIIFFGAAAAKDGGSIFGQDLKPRNGSYPQYHSSDIRTLHASYFRRRWPEERAFHLANLRKSPEFHLVAQELIRCLMWRIRRALITRLRLFMISEMSGFRLMGWKYSRGRM